MSKNVALVLSSGSSRGLAHIGGIEALEERGYTISSIAGCSMGAIVAGMFAAGKLPELKAWFLDMTRRHMFELMDFTLTKNYLVKGEKLMGAIGDMIPDYQMENLNIPLSLVATDMKKGEEVVFRSGNLNHAIRASFALPVLLQPVQDGDRLLMDGGMSNPLPLNRVQRTEGDILACVNVSGAFITKPEEEKEPSWLETMIEKYAGKKLKPTEKQMSTLSILDRCSDVMIQQHTELMKQYCPPDICVDIAMNQFGSFEYDNAEEIIRFGYDRMMAQIDEYEKKQG
ncbi:MAG: patatin-like phospholipase family protein [Paludibacteraceae bacterium]|nr:patatin-like phospholipase family protein [Paludibacteraceae bacterium]MCR4664719.1 patatin-like phospholipase family protein [Paludibacteraceae bacterium]